MTTRLTLSLASVFLFGALSWALVLPAVSQEDAAEAPADDTPAAEVADPAEPVAEPAQAAKDELSVAELAEKQDRIREKYERLETLLLKLAEYEAIENPRKAELLKKAYQQSRERLTNTQLNSLVKLLAEAQLRRAIDGQKVVRTDLDALLELLQSENRFDRLKDEQARIREYIKEIERLQRIERGIAAGNQAGDDAQRLAGDQGSAADRAAKLGEQIAGHEAVGGNKGQNDGDSKSDGENDGDSKSDGDSKGDSESMGDSKGDSESMGDSEGDSKSMGDSEGDSKSMGDSEGDSESMGDSKGDSESMGDSKGDSKSMGDSEGDSKSMGDSEGNSESMGDSKGDSESMGDSKGDSKSMGDSEGDSSSNGDSSDAPKPPSNPSQEDENPVRKRIKAAEEKMKQAQRKLEEAKRAEAEKAIKEAEEELAKAKFELEEILRQLREEEIERMLAALEARFTKMLEMQLKIYEGTLRLDKVAADERNRQFDIQAGVLSRDQRAVSAEADRAYTLLLEEGSSIAFPEAVDQMREDMDQVAERLARSRVSNITQVIEQDIIAALEDMIEALQKAQQEPMPPMEMPPGEPPPPGPPQDKPLVDEIAELKMIKAMQVRVNKRTTRYSRLLEDVEDAVGQADDADLIDALERLGEREVEIKQITRDIVLGKNQ